MGLQTSWLKNGPTKILSGLVLGPARNGTLIKFVEQPWGLEAHRSPNLSIRPANNKSPSISPGLYVNLGSLVTLGCCNRRRSR